MSDSPEESPEESPQHEVVDTVGNVREYRIETAGLSRQFAGKWAVRDLNLRVHTGELYGFLGQNGAGKTTTLRLLAGLLRPTSGEARIAGLSHAEDSRALKMRLGFVPDTPPLYDYLTGRQYIALVASMWRIDRKLRDERADRLLDLLHMSDVADDLCKSYSHGMRKKVHLAAVLTTAPEVLLLDEPTTGLDPGSTRRLKDLLRVEVGRGTTVLFSTHVLDTAEEICDRVGILAKGRLLAEGTVAELRAQHGNRTLEDVFLALTDDDVSA
ncbi:MAG: ABC-2 type transport system ATP-binding protein [Hyphomicrobiaceae bacterium]|jgi:ABC-2 type transport system ATP-binding protein